MNTWVYDFMTSWGGMGDRPIDDERINIMLSRKLHIELMETKPYEEDVQSWADYVLAEGLHAVQAQREEEQ